MNASNRDPSGPAMVRHALLSVVLLSLSLAANAAAPPAATLDTGPKVGYENFEAPGVFTTTVQSNGNTTEYLGRGAGEPSIGVNWKSPAPNNVYGVTNFQSDLQSIFVTFNDSCPATGSKSIWANRPAPTSQGVDSDPIGFTNIRTGRVFAAELTLLSPTCKVSYSDTDGVSWTPTTGPGGSAVDHQTIGGGPYHLVGGLPPPYGTAGLEAFYYCSQDIVNAYCLRSDDGGLSWQPQTEMYSLLDCGGLHGHVKVSPFDGTVFVPNADCGSGIGAVAVSETNGATWSVRLVQNGSVNLGGSSSDPAVGIDDAGRVYFAIASGDQYLGVATSTNNGVSWQNLANVTGQLGIKGVRYPAAVGGGAGRAAIAFYGTKTTGNFNGNTFWGEWHLYIAHTFDGGATWTVSDATPNLPMQRGCIWTNGGGEICRNLLDFFDIAYDKQGRVQVGYVNGCPGGACSQAAPTAKGNDYSATATIARQSSGRRLLAAFDPANPQTATSLPGMPTVTARRVGTITHLAWSEGDTGNSPITEYQIWRGTASGSGKVLVATVAGDQTRYDDTTANDYTKTYYYDVLAVNAVGSSCANNEVKVAYVGDTCPGIVIHQNDPSHPESAPVQNGANSNLAIDYISVGEPIGDLLNPSTGAVVAAKGTYLMFKMKVTDLASVPPDSRWRLVWNSYSSSRGLFYVGARSGASGAPTFDYGTVGDAGLPAVLVLSEVKTGDGLLGSSFNAGGTMTIYVPKSGLGNPLPGDLLGALGGKTFTGDSGPAGNYQRSTALVDHTFIKGVTDNSFPAAAYMLRDAAHVTNNRIPVATFAADVVYGNAPLAVNFTGTQSDADGDAPGSYVYEFGEGSPQTKSCGAAPYLTPACAGTSHTYASPGYYTATLTALDDCGKAADPLSIQIHVNAPPVADAGADFTVNEGENALLSGASSSDADGDALTYSWTQIAGPAWR
jgi:PKD repeat protein